MEKQPNHAVIGIQKLFGCWLLGILGCLWVAQGIALYFEEPKLLMLTALVIIAGGLGYAMKGAYQKGFTDGLESAKDSSSE